MRSLILRLLAVLGLVAATALVAVPASAREYSRYGHNYIGHNAHHRAAHHYTYHQPRYVPRHHSGYRHTAPRRHDNNHYCGHGRSYYRSHRPTVKVIVTRPYRHH